MDIYIVFDSLISNHILYFLRINIPFSIFKIDIY